jgi:D-2-hydroxyglutarate dehydrogenase
MADLLEPFVFERVAAYKGSVSAEHGIGQCKVPYLSFSKSEASISLMRSLKDVMDPRGILNPYKVLPSAP